MAQVVCSCTPQWFVRLGLASRRRDLKVALACLLFHCIFFPLVVGRPSLWLGFLAPRPCGYVDWSRQFCPSLPDLLSASIRCPAESRTLSLRRVSRWPLLAHQSRHRCSRPLQLWAPRLARRFLCRNLNHNDAHLKQLMGSSHGNSLARCWERSAAQLVSAARRFHPAGPTRSWSWWRRVSSQLPPRTHVQHDLTSLLTCFRSLRQWLRACLLQRCRAYAPAGTRLTLRRAPAPTSVSLPAPTVQEKSGTAFSTPLASTFLQSTSYSS